MWSNVAHILVAGDARKPAIAAGPLAMRSLFEGFNEWKSPGRVKRNANRGTRDFRGGKKNMAKLTEAASKAWEARQGPCVLTTVDSKRNPNSVWVTNVNKIADDKIVIADNKFCKTRDNIIEGSKVSLLYITAEKEAYQIKGTADYLTEGPIYDDMKKGWLDPKFAGHGAVVINVEEVFKGAEKLV